MLHPRQIIRQTIVELLQAGKIDAAPSCIFDTHDKPLFTDDLPAISVYTQSERLEDTESQDFGLRRRIMSGGVECYHSGDSGAEIVDKLSWQIENILHANPTLNNLVEWCKLTDTSIAFAEEGERVLHAAAMTFEVTYCTHLYEVEGLPPVTVLYGFDPQTGKGNEDYYSPVGGVKQRR